MFPLHPAVAGLSILSISSSLLIPQHHRQGEIPVYRRSETHATHGGFKLGELIFFIHTGVVIESQSGTIFRIERELQMSPQRGAGPGQLEQLFGSGGRPPVRQIQLNQRSRAQLNQSQVFG